MTMTSVVLDPLWTTEDVSRYLGVPVKTLYEWRLRKYGPPAARVGRFLRYRQTDVVEWLASVTDPPDEGSDRPWHDLH
ncbi:MAG: helix-turn-helix domain-containing protein [Nocardioidaceae bacterium]